MAQTVAASGGEWIEKSGLSYRKSISAPNTEGVYYITLESFTTGTVTLTNESIPADIVLVLDYSGSMADKMDGSSNANDNSTNEANWSKMKVLRRAVLSFIEEIDTNDLKDPDTGLDRPDGRLGNRISIIRFSSNGTASTLVKLRRLDNGGKQAMINAVNGLTNPTGGTYAEDGMQLAYNELNFNDDTRKIRTAVLFTDGDPGSGNYWEDVDRVKIGNKYYNLLSNRSSHWGESTWVTANEVIRIANDIKGLTNETKKISANVYTVSVIKTPSKYAQVYLGKTSSNWKDATKMATLKTIRYNGNTRYYLDPAWNGTDIWANGDGTLVSGANFAYSTTNASELNSIFKSIAHASGGTTAPVNEGTVSQVDVVSASFTLPDGATDDNIEVYTVRYTGNDASGKAQFKTRTVGSQVVEDLVRARTNTDTYLKKWTDDNNVAHEEITDVDDGITWHLTATEAGGKKDKITINGFDYANLFCGPDASVNTGPYPGWHQGYKLVVKIPIKMDKEAVGGPNLNTNGPNSGIYVNGVNQFPFTSPKVSLPVNIHIRKEGLSVGESAKFTIERTTDGENWTPVTSVFVTRTGNDTQEGENAPLTKVSGLPATDNSTPAKPYVYRVVEEKWSWSYNSGHTTPVTTDLLETNPFIFTNTKKDQIDIRIRNAESKATNIFLPGETEGHYIASKAR